MTLSRRMYCAAFALLGVAVVGIAVGCGVSGKAPDAPTESDSTPAADSIGEALFLDTRFAEFFAANMTGVNDPLPAGDPVVAEVQTTSTPLPGPFAGQSINCRSCHFVTEFEGVQGGGNRTYADFTTRSPMNPGRGRASETCRSLLLRPRERPARRLPPTNSRLAFSRSSCR